MVQRQLFLYVTQQCNIRCIMCYSLDTLERGRDLTFEETIKVLRYFRNEGIQKLSLLGGEPTKYAQLPELIEGAAEIGYTFIRIATNGIFNRRLLDDPRVRILEVICFSIDGATPEVNDPIRNGGRLWITLRNLDYAK
jgi:MoaA/NifB/PqqE/SkfB family radical SAM enzyme